MSNPTTIDKIKMRMDSMTMFQRNLLIFGTAFVACSFVLPKIAAFLNGEMKSGYLRGLWLVYTTVPGLIATACFALAITVVLFLVRRRNGELDTVKAVDERGFAIAKNGGYGTSEWMSKDVAKEVYEVCPVEECEGAILGQFDTSGKEVVALPYIPESNRNLILLGPPGSGKSFGYVRTAVFQSIRQGESLVVTDPKGEIHNDMRKLLEANGYTVWVFNLINLQKSDAWDIMQEIYNPRTGDISEERVISLCETMMKNTSPDPTKEDGFWGPGEKNLFKVAVLYSAYVREQSLLKIYERRTRECLDQLDFISDEDKDKILELVDSTNPETEMNERREICLGLLERVLGDAGEAARILKGYESEAPTCTIDEIYHSLLFKDLTQWENDFRTVPLSHPAAAAWTIFKNGGNAVQPGFITGLNQRLQIFQMRDVRRIICNDDIRLEQIGEKKTALFLVISDDNTSMQVLSSLMFSFLFRDLKEAYDYVNGKGRRPVNVIADEIANTGTWPNFEKTIGTARSRKIAVSIVLQNLPQLSQLYGPDNAQSIIGCCNTMLVLGCNDDYSAKYISELSGIVTIRTKSTKDSRANVTGYRAPIQGYSVSEGDGKRYLLNKDEVRALKESEILIYRQGQRMLKINRFGYTLHPYAKDPNFVKTSWDELPSAKEKYKDAEKRDAFCIGDIQNLYEKNRGIANARDASRYAPAQENAESQSRVKKNAGESSSEPVRSAGASSGKRNQRDKNAFDR